MRTTIITTITTFIVLFLMVSLCHSIQLNTLSFGTGNGKLIIDAVFDKTVTYTVRAENNGTSLILRVPSATYSKTIADQITIPPNTVLSNWSIKESEGFLMVEFRLTGPYSYSHASREPRTVQIEIFGVQQQNPLNSPPTNDTDTESPPEKPVTGLARGIELYNNGHYDEALNEFKGVLKTTNRCPLLYYYSAHIRIKKKQLNRAEENLLAALRDSASFTDARGLLAYTRQKLGKPNDALADWREFVSSAGFLGEKTAITLDSIMLPEDYRSLLRSQEEERLKAEALEKARTDSLISASQPAPNDSASAQGGSEALGALENRIRKNIRVGIYGLSAFAALIVLFIGGAVILIQRRSRSKIDLTFNTEIKRILDQQPVDKDLLEDVEDYTASEYRSISREIETIEQIVESSTQETEEIETTFDVAETPYTQSLQSAPFERRSDTITEEVKALVTRMYKEGRSIPEISRAADLTQTEVELIVAVRARRIEKLVEDVAIEADEYLDRDHLYKAISELKYEGNTNRDIARKLGVSTSEVQLTLSLMAMRKKRRG